MHTFTARDFVAAEMDKILGAIGKKGYRRSPHGGRQERELDRVPCQTPAMRSSTRVLKSASVRSHSAASSSSATGEMARLVAPEMRIF